MTDPEVSVWTRLTEPSVLLSALTFLTLIATWLRSSIVSRRDRRWAREDRKEAAQQLEALKDASEVTHTKIDENTEISVAAFKEANDVNLKINSVAEALNISAKKQFEASKQEYQDAQRRFEEALRRNREQAPDEPEPHE